MNFWQWKNAVDRTSVTEYIPYVAPSRKGSLSNSEVERQRNEHCVFDEMQCWMIRTIVSYNPSQLDFVSIEEQNKAMEYYKIHERIFKRCYYHKKSDVYNKAKIQKRSEEIANVPVFSSIEEWIQATKQFSIDHDLLQVKFIRRPQDSDGLVNLHTYVNENGEHLIRVWSTKMGIPKHPRNRPMFQWDTGFTEQQRQQLNTETPNPGSRFPAKVPKSPVSSKLEHDPSSGRII
eukprot:scaffold1445_cov235-Pinguiococcus_pyrenoidosus.AAC.4